MKLQIRSKSQTMSNEIELLHTHLSHLPVFDLNIDIRMVRVLFILRQ